jgi:hypothetical protein
MHKLSFAGIVALVATIAALAVSGIASGAIGPDSGIAPSTGTSLIQNGKCTGTSTSWLEVSKVKSSVKVTFAVRTAQLPTLQPIHPTSWKVRLVRNSAVDFDGIVSAGSSGLLTVTRYFAPSATPTQIVAGAKALDGSESCSATISF